MDTKDANLALVRDAYARWGSERAGSFEHWMDLLAEDLRFCSLGAGAPGLEFSQACYTKAGVRDYFLRIAADWEVQRFTPEHFLADGDWVVMRGGVAWRHRRTGKVVDTPKADFLRLRDGKIVEFHEFYDTAAAIGATQ